MTYSVLPQLSNIRVLRKVSFVKVIVGRRNKVKRFTVTAQVDETFFLFPPSNLKLSKYKESSGFHASITKREVLSFVSERVAPLAKGKLKDPFSTGSSRATVLCRGKMSRGGFGVNVVSVRGGSGSSVKLTSWRGYEGTRAP